MKLSRIIEDQGKQSTVSLNVNMRVLTVAQDEIDNVKLIAPSTHTTSTYKLPKTRRDNNRPPRWLSQRMRRAFH